MTDLIDATSELPPPPEPPTPSAPPAPPAPAPAAQGVRLRDTKPKVRRIALMNFSRQLAAFLGAGISITEALRVLRADARDRRVRALVDGLADGVQQGATMADSLDALPVQLPPYYVPMVRAGEATGRIDEVLLHLTADLDRELTTRRKVQSAVTYPIVVLCVGVVVVMVMIGFVLPRYQDFFSSIDAELPWITGMLLKAGSLGPTQMLVLLLLGLCGLLGLALWGRTEEGAHRLHRTMLRVPVVGAMARDLAVERFCRSLSAMLRAGTPLPLSLEVAAEATGNREFVVRLGEARRQVIAGDSLSGSVTATGLFPAAATQMIRVGEETGTLDDQLAGAADFYERELTHTLGRFTTLFETGVILAIGLAVGVVAVALVSAMFGIYDKVQV